MADKPDIIGATNPTPPNTKMNKLNPENSDAKLSALLRESRVAPALPPRFQEGVWRRIEDAETAARPVGNVVWLQVLAGWVLRPKLAFATAAALVLAGVLLGARDGMETARHDAQARYLAAVAPNALR